jgi:hypothetical protein
MCFAARDYFVAGKPVPAYTKVDEIPSDFLLYLWNRQLDSLGLLVVPKVIEWMLRNDNDVGRLTAQYEIPKIRRRLDQGQPVVIALIRVQRGDDPTRNHQVLAMGYDLDDLAKRITLYLYDPNHPAQEPTISLNLVHPSLGIEPEAELGQPDSAANELERQRRHGERVGPAPGMSNHRHRHHAQLSALNFAGRGF